MESLFNIIKSPIATTKANSERAELIGFFVEEINKERPCTYKVKGKKKTLPLITARAVAVKLGHVKNLSELQYFLSECKDYRSRHGSFSKRFFGGLKIDNAIYLEKDNEKK